MKTFSLALRNILRNRRRSLTTLLAMVIGALTILLFGGYSRDISYGLETSYVQRGGHLQIQKKDYFLYGSGNPAAYGIANYQAIIDRIRQDPVLAKQVVVITPTLQLGGVAGNFAEGVSRTVLATGMVVEEQNRLKDWNDYGTFQKPRTSELTGTSEDAALIGTGVARVLQLCDALKVANCVQFTRKKSSGENMPADIAELSSVEKPAAARDDAARIELLAANSHGAPNVTGLKVVKAEVQGVKELDDVYVAMHLSQAQRLLYGSEAPRVTAIVLQLQHTDQIPLVRQRLEKILPRGSEQDGSDAFEVNDFTTLNPFYKQAIAMFNTIFGFIAVLIGAIVLFTVGNTMSMAVVERTVEIGTLRALGLRRDGIRKLFVLEGLLLGVIGAALGVLAALLVAGLINFSGLSWTPPGWARTIPLVVRVWGEGKMIAACAVGIVLVSAMSAWWPARRGARLAIVDALRHV